MRSTPWVDGVLRAHVDEHFLGLDVDLLVGFDWAWSECEGFGLDVGVGGCGHFRGLARF